MLRIKVRETLIDWILDSTWTGHVNSHPPSFLPPSIHSPSLTLPPSTMPVPLTATAHNQQSYPHPNGPLKTVKHKSSKPIINWLQRKLGGTVRARRPTNPTNIRGSADSTYSGRATSLKDLHPSTVRGRAPAPKEVNENGQLVRPIPTRTLSNQISLNSTAEMSDPEDDGDDGLSNRRSSGAATSMWGSRSNP